MKTEKIPFRPLLDRVLLMEMPESQQVTDSGIFLLDNANERPKKSEVIATGEGKNGIKPGIKPGDIVLHGRAAGFKMKYNNEEYLIIRESDIFAVID